MNRFLPLIYMLTAILGTVNAVLAKGSLGFYLWSLVVTCQLILMGRACFKRGKRETF